jgi:aryl-alcohol dehydrogenase-like predicted oxidoreductase
MTDNNVILGALSFGTRIDRDSSFRLLDEYVDLGGRWIDTANNYSGWIDPSGHGGQSETVIGQWLAARPGRREQVALSTKTGAENRADGTREGLSRDAITSAVRLNLSRLGVDHIDLYWAHVEDRSVPLEEQVTAFGELVADGTAGALGASNHPVWRIERARALARSLGLPGYSAVQLRWSYLRPRPAATLPDSGHVLATEETFDYVRSTDGMRLWAYNTLLNGSYARTDRPLAPAYDHPGTTRRLAALDEVAADAGVSRNQVVLAWLMAAGVEPIVGVTRSSQVTEAMAARDVKLSPEHLSKLNDSALS